jgi:hypothetical protein
MRQCDRLEMGSLGNLLRGRLFQNRIDRGANLL